MLYHLSAYYEYTTYSVEGLGAKMEQRSAEPDLTAALPDNIMTLLNRGRTERTTVLPGTEGPNSGTVPYARTHVEIDFTSDEDLLNCVKLLHWSDERLRSLPNLLAMWEWHRTEREGMTIYFSTNWYDKDFFEARNTAFLGKDHAHYYSLFGATVDNLRTRHEIM